MVGFDQGWAVGPLLFVRCYAFSYRSGGVTPIIDVRPYSK
jgi:hypothetical protein